MAKVKTKLKPKQVQAVGLLISGQTEEQVSANVGVSRTTLTGWLRDNTFADELRLANERLRQMFESRVMGLANNAAVVVGEMIEDKQDKERQLEGAKLAFNAAVRLANRYKELQVEGIVAPAQPLVVFPVGTKFPWQNKLAATKPLEIPESTDDELSDGEVIDVEAVDVSGDDQ